ncbi:hypothetical protein MRX96_008768 [Rhipicephalus microplus]
MGGTAAYFVLTAFFRHTVVPLQKSLLDSEPFRQLLEAMELCVCSRQRALPQDFQTCMTYTIVALLAPTCNKVGRYLCQAISNIFSQLVDLLRTSQISEDILVRLLENEVAIEPMECFVLPSMDIATAIAVSFKLFPDCRFRRFKRLKRFWKKTEHTPINSDLLVQYGYRLPDQTEEMMIYVKVQFRTRRDHYYVYPILCVRSREAQSLARINPYPIIGFFLQYVKLRMGQLCGELFSMVSHIPAFPIPQLRWTAKDAQVMHKSPRNKASTRKCWTIAEVDSLLKQKKFDMLNKVNSAMLLAWLCHNNVPCNIKTKESDTLFKIAQELIFRESHVTAAPVLQAPYSVMATIPKSLLDSEPFRQLLEAMELRVCSRQRAQPQDFQTCLTYTMVALVAPAWNKVGRYLCQGRDFLVADGVIPAVDWQILATKTKTELTLCGLGIRLRHMTLVDLLGTSKISHETWVQLRENEVAIEPMECFVLPSMKIALATAVSFKLFSDCPFRSFKDLKKFWKNTEHTPINSDLLVQYGYRLPDQTEEMMIYVKVQFQTRRDHYYVYPILCVRPREAQSLARINPYPIIGSFLQYVKLRMGQLCGEPFSMVSRIPAFPTPQLRWTAKDAQTGIDNVSWTPRPSCQVPYRPQVSFEAPTVTVFIGDLEVVSECDDESSRSGRPCHPNKANNHQKITFNHHSAAPPRPAPPIKPKVASLSIIKTKDEKRITFERYSSHKRVATGAAKTLASPGEKAYQDEEASYSCTTNILVDENATDREIAWQPLQSTPKEADDLTPLCSLHLEVMHKSPRNKASTRKCWTIAEVDSLLKQKKFDMLNKVNSAVLLAWLRHNNVRCNIKTKKSDILSKIAQYAAEV